MQAANTGITQSVETAGPHSFDRARHKGPLGRGAVDVTDHVMDLAKRRGFLWPAYEVYGGAAGFYDYGPLGSTMKTRFEDLWRHTFRTSAFPTAEVTCPRVTIHDVLKASGHVDEFTDLVVKCANGHPTRADHLVEAAGFEGTADALDAAAIDNEIAARSPKCPVCGDKKWTEAAPMNLMFNTEIGPGSGRVGYLRPETAQGIFTDFPHLLRYFRGRLPFAALQVGGSNRNEISPRQGMLRLREFNMMEAEVFFEDTNAPVAAFNGVKGQKAVFVPNSDEQPVTTSFGDAVTSGMVANEALAYFMALTHQFLLEAGMDPARVRFRQHLDDEMAHYASDCWDAEVHSDRYGWVECVGIADRGCFDLTQHAQASGKAGDFTVTVDLPEPITFEATAYEPNMGILGRTFKAQAKPIAAALAASFDPAGAIRDAGHDGAWLDEEPVLKGPDAVPAQEPITLEVEGESIQVPAEAVLVRKGTWTVTGYRIIPRVIEPSFGVDRILYALWEHAYESTEKEGEAYTRMRLSPKVAPIQAAVLPLTSKDGLPELADQIEADLRGAGLLTDRDAAGSIGRRYARQDEVGTPFCITVDNDSLQDDAVTVRDRDTTEQARVPIAEVATYIRERVTN